MITVFDGDSAGVQATLRSLPLFLEEEIVGKTVLLPKGEDPDGFLRKGNLEDFEKRLQRAVPIIDFFFERLMKVHDVKSVDGKVQIAKEGVALLGKIPDKIRRDFYTRALAEKLDVKESFLYEMLGSSPREPSKPKGDGGRSSGESVFPKSEVMMVHLMAQHPEIISTVSREDVLREFESPILQKIAKALEDLYQKKGRFNLAQALAYFDEDLQGKVSELALREEGLEEGDQGKILEDCIQKIREKRIKREKGELQRRIKEVDQQQEDKRLGPLLKQKLELARQREKGLQKDGFRKR